MKNRSAFLLLLLCHCFLLPAQTVLQPGDIAIVNMNADAPDSWAFVPFVDLAVGTTILFTDNGYERNVAAGANTWGNTEEVIQLTVTTLVPAGTVVTYNGALAAPHTAPASFTHTSIVSSGSGRLDQFVATGDGIMVLQGTWNNGTTGSHNATFTGTFVWGFNGRPWFTGASYNSTDNSRLPAQLACANAGFTHIDNYAYSGTSSGTYATLMAAITNSANWTTNDATSLAAPTGPITVTGGTTTAIWNGSVSTDWFNCANWDILRVPNATTDVIFPTNNTGNRDIVFNAGTHAQCRNFTLNPGGTRQVKGENGATKQLSIFGDLLLNANDALDFRDGSPATADGTIHIHGNWTNGDAAWFQDGNSTVNFVGTGNQAITCLVGGYEVFYNLNINKPSGKVILAHSIAAGGDPTDPLADRAGVLTLSNGRIETGVNHVYVTNQAAGAVTGHSVNSYINGNLRRQINGSGTNAYAFPLGTATQYELGTVTFTNPAGFSTLDGAFLTSFSASTISLVESAVTYELLLDYGIWNFSPTTGSMTGGSYALQLHERGYSNGLATSYIVVKRNGVTAWTNPGTHGTWSEVGGTVACSRTGLTSFSEFAIARPAVLPLRLGYFEAAPLDGNSARLSWRLSEAEDFQAFLLERALGDGQFVHVAEVPVAGESDGAFGYDDLDLAEGTHLYRLAALDRNGSITRLGTAMVNIGAHAQLSLHVWPNPSAYLVSVHIGAGSAPVRAHLVDLSGRVLYNADGDAEQLSATLAERIAALPAGHYLLLVAQGTQQLKQAIIKSE